MNRSFSLAYGPVERNGANTRMADALMEVVSGAEEVRVVSPYLGTQLLEFVVQDGVPFRLVSDLDAAIHNDRRGALVRWLTPRLTQVRHLPGVHAKVVVGKTAAMFGSANLTRMAFTKRVEMGCVVRDADSIQELTEWFEEVWRVATVVEPERIAERVEVWRRYEGALKAADVRAPKPPGLHTLGSLGPLRPRVAHRMRVKSAGADRLIVGQGVRLGGRVKSRLGKRDHGALAATVPACFADEELALVARLRSWTTSRADAEFVLRLLAEALEVSGLQEHDDGLHLNTTSDNVSVTVGQRYVAAFGREAKVPVFKFALGDFVLADRLAADVPGATQDPFTSGGTPDMPYLMVPMTELAAVVPTLRTSWHAAIRHEVSKQGKSGYLRHKRGWMFGLLGDVARRDALLDVAWPAAWWFGVNNAPAGKAGHMHLEQVRPLWAERDATVVWPVGNSKRIPSSAYRDMRPGDHVMIWTGHGHSPGWGVLGTCSIVRVEPDHVVLGDGEAFRRPLTPYPRGEARPTPLSEWLLALFGEGFRPLGDVRRALEGTPRVAPVTVAAISREQFQAVRARGRVTIDEGG